MKYTFDVFNLTNTPSFDIPVDNVDQNLNFNDFPIYGTPALPCTSRLLHLSFHKWPGCREQDDR